MGHISLRNEKEHKKPRMGSKPIPLRLLTWNIRYDWMQRFSEPFHTQKETRWSQRREKLVAGLEFHAATHGIIALQEVLHGQLIDIHSMLNKNDPDKWQYIGVGRDDGRQNGEYSPIFYNTDIHELISWRCFWLSDTPDRPGRGWDAASIRICTVGRFGFRTADKTAHDFTSTHFDDQGAVAREKAAKLILEAVDFEFSSSTCPVFLLGDLNSPENDNAYRTISPRMHDLRGICTSTFGHHNTFTGFDGKKGDLSRIDHIFGTRGDGWDGGIYTVEENHFEDEIWLSDHRLVMADVFLGKDLKPGEKKGKE